MTMTQDQANHIIKTSTRCTQATLRAFGIEGYPHYGSGCLEYFTKNNFHIQEMKVPKGHTMRFFYLYCMFKDKEYFIITKGHAMALINGILVDTTLKGFDNRKIENIWIVRKSVGYTV